MGAYEITIYHAVVLSAVLLGLIIVAFGIAIVRSQRRLFDRSRRQYQAEIALLKERNQIAQDLHDELGPVLAATRMQVEQIGACTTGAEALVEAAEANLQDIIVRLRGIVGGLVPEELIHNGLEELIRQHLDQCRLLHNVRFHFTYEVQTPLQLEAIQHLFAIVKELVHNTLRHAGAQMVVLQLRERGQCLYLHFRDDGSGFNVLHKQRKGRGLTGLRERTQHLNGRMELFSKEGEGSTFYFEIPIQHGDHTSSDRRR